jgi:hypothetical protein
MSSHKEHVPEVKDLLARTRSRITLFSDAWSSLNYYLLLGVVRYWIDEERQLKTGLLALKVLEGHYGFEIADVLQGVITSYGIEDKDRCLSNG